MHLTRLLLPILLLPILAGCRSDAPVTAKADTYDPSWLTLGSTEIRDNVRVGDARRLRDDHDILFITVPVRNVTSKQLYVEYEVDFLDKQGMQVSKYTKTLTIPRGTRDATANSTSAKAETFRMQMRYPRVN